MTKRKGNSIDHPEAWAFFIKQARNIEKEPDINSLGKYRIPEPNQSLNFIYANDPGELWGKFIRIWYAESLNAESLQGRIRYIAHNFNH